MLPQRQIKFLAVVFGALALLAVSIYFGYRGSSHKKVVKLTMWGVYDTEDAYHGMIAKFQQDQKVIISYVQKQPETYETELVNALAAGRGPDIFMIGNSWIQKHYDKSLPAPKDLVSAQTVGEFYPQVVLDDFVSGDTVWALPLSVDTLALFYNPDLLNQAAITFPPKTWEELVQMVPKLVKINSATGAIEQAAVSLGRARNINRAPDVLSLLMMQSGAKVARDFHADLGAPALEALNFFTQFARPTGKLYTWNEESHYSIDAFSEGTLAFTFNYAYHTPTFKAKAPFIKFKIAPMLQPAGAPKRLDFANYWGYTVARTSAHPKEAWQFIAYLTDVPQARQYMRATNRPPARKELIREVQDDPVLGIFGNQALTALTWPQPDPPQVDAIFENMIESVNTGRRSPNEALQDADDRLNLLFNKIR